MTQEELPSADLLQAMERSGLHVRGFYADSTSGNPSSFDTGSDDGRLLLRDLETIEETGDGESGGQDLGDQLTFGHGENP